MIKDDYDAVARHWDRKTTARTSRADRWWRSPHVVRHHNRRICGSPLSGISAGIVDRLRRCTSGLPLRRGISVGCGTGGKELNLLKSGLVESFDLYEISPARIAVGERLFADAGLSDRARFVSDDPFRRTAGDFDLVYWDSALHHMPDAHAALAWSHGMLRTGGVLLIHDYVGPNRLQWTDRCLHWCNRLRATLPERLLRHAQDASRVMRVIERPDAEALRLQDPSEAPDSESIISAVGRFFRGPIELIGGCVYDPVLADVVWNFHEQQAFGELDVCLMIDELLTELGERHIGFFIGRKEPASAADDLAPSVFECSHLRSNDRYD